MKKQIGRKELINTDLNQTIPNPDIENPWFNKKIVDVMNQPRKNLQDEDNDKTNKMTKAEIKYLEHVYTFIDKLNVVKGKIDLNTTKTTKYIDEEIEGRVNTYNVSSYGYHYWDPTVHPKSSNIQWPPLPKKAQHNYNCHLDFNKQSNRIDIQDMTNNVHELRFEMVDKRPENLSN